MKYSIQIAAILILTGCTQRFVVMHQVPENPSFIVVPVTYSLHQIEFANKVEAALLETGVRIDAMPPTKKVLTEQQTETTEISPAGGQVTEQRTLIEQYKAFDGLTADYIVATYAGSRQIRIINRHTHQVITSFTVPPNTAAVPGAAFRSDIKNAIEAMGIQK